MINLLSGYVQILGVSQVSAANISTSRLVELANQERAANGRVSLKLNSKLNIAAANKANDMFKKGYWAHYGPNGETPWQFILGSGYSYIYAGENLAKDFVTTDAVHSAWMASPTHRANILKTEYRDIGMAAVTGFLNGEETTIVVQMFGSTGTSTSGSGTTNLPTTGSSGSKSPSTPATAEPPVITEPESDKTYNDALLPVKGTTKDSKEVTIYDGDTKLGTLIPEGGIFDYRPAKEWTQGSHTVTATATHKTSGTVSKKSNAVTFILDSVAPKFNQESITVTPTTGLQDTSVAITLDIDKDTTSVKMALGSQSYELSKSEKEIEDKDLIRYTGTFKISNSNVIKYDYKAKLVAEDLAGNKDDYSINLSPNESDEKIILGISASRFAPVLSLVARINTFSFVTKVTLLLGLFIVVVLIIDAVALWRIGVIREGAKSLMPAFIFTTVLLVGVFVGLDGTLV